MQLPNWTLSDSSTRQFSYHYQLTQLIRYRKPKYKAQTPSPFHFVLRARPGVRWRRPHVSEVLRSGDAQLDRCSRAVSERRWWLDTRHRPGDTQRDRWRTGQVFDVSGLVDRSVRDRPARLDVGRRRHAGFVSLKISFEIVKKIIFEDASIFFNFPYFHRNMWFWRSQL